MTQSTLSASALRCVLNQAAWDFKLALTHGEQLLVALILPCFALIGLTQTSILSIPTAAGLPLINVVTPGILALALMSSAFTGVAIGTGFDRRSDVLLHLATTPLGRSGFITGRCVALCAQQAVQLLIIGSLAYALGWRPHLAGLVIAVLFAVLATWAFTALALALAGTLRAEAVLAIANLIWIFAAGLGVVLPLTTLPLWLQSIAQFSPATALAEGLRQATLHGELAVLPLITVVLWAVLGSAITARWFSWQS